MTSSFDIGDVVTLTTEVRDKDMVLVVPDTITLKVRDPAGTVTTLVPTNDSLGAYHYDLTIATDGLFVYRWTTTGPGSASDEREFFVRPRRVS